MGRPLARPIELKPVYAQWVQQRTNTKNRLDCDGKPIEFNLTFDEWYSWWMATGHYNERGHTRGQYVMARKNDRGHYELGNIECKLTADNLSERTHYRTTEKYLQQKEGQIMARTINNRKAPEALKHPNRVAPITPTQIHLVKTREQIRTNIADPATTDVVWSYTKELFDARRVKGDKPGDCWDWIGSGHRQGYGLFPVVSNKLPLSKKGNPTGQMMNAQRLAVAIKLGRPLRGNAEQVFATCHNPRCTNPDHLQVGSRHDACQNAPSRTWNFSEYRTKYDTEYYTRYVYTTRYDYIAAEFGIKNEQASHLKGVTKARVDAIREAGGNDDYPFNISPSYVKKYPRL
jgi:hypothetical protein